MFWSFIVKTRAEKTARNISKNTTLVIPAHNIPAFKHANMGDEIVPVGQYDLIEPFFMGLTRGKIGDVALGKSENFGKYHWGIINLSGEEVIPVEYTELWQFHLKEKTKIRMAKDAEYQWLDLYDIAPYPYNIKTDADGCIMDAEYFDQLREDYRTDDMSDAFDGDPDALWNID